MEVAEGEAVHLRIQAVVEQGPPEYLYAGKPVEREEAREARRLEEERLSNWQPRGQSMVDEQLLYDRWLQSLENDKDVIRALGFATLLQFRNRAWEEEQKWRREANEARQLRQQEWKQRAAELREEQARDANDDTYGRRHPTTAARDPDMTANVARQTQLEDEDETAELEGIAAQMEHREDLNRRSAEESKDTGAQEIAVEVRNRGDTYEEWLRTRPRHVLDELYQSGELQDGEVVSIWGSKMLRSLAQTRWDRRRAQEEERAEKELDKFQGGPRRRRGDSTD